MIFLLGVSNVLKTANIKTVADLIETCPRELLHMQNFGKNSIADIEKTMKRYIENFTNSKNNWDFESYIENEAILSVNNQDIDFSARVSNVLKTANIKTVADLIETCPRELLYMQNFGKNSIADIEKTMKRYIENFINSDVLPYQILPLDNILGVGSDERQQEIIKMRWGFYDNEEKTLEFIAQKLGITRERVRQIEKKSIKTIQKTFVGIKPICDKISDLLADYKPLEIDSLPYLDNFFSEYKNNIVFLGNIITKIINSDLHIVLYKDTNYLLSISQKQFDKVISKLFYLEQYVGFDTEYFLIYFENRCKEYNIKEFYNMLKMDIFDTLAYDEKTQNIIGDLKSTKSRVSSILNTIEVPLHFEEIHKKYAQQFGKKDIRRIHGILSKIGYLYGRGIYGSLQHLDIDKNRQTEIVQYAEQIVKNLDKQVHAREILLELSKKGVDCRNLDDFKVQIILSNSNSIQLRDLGKSTWVHKSSNTKVLKEFTNIIYDVLKQTKAPMHGDDIKQKVNQVRTVAENFIIQETAYVKKLGKNYWCLAEFLN